MSTDWRALCIELLEALDGWHKAVFETGTGWGWPDETYLIDRARAALAAEPVVEGPTDEEVEAWADQQGFVRGHADLPFGFWIDYVDVGALVRAALSRWGSCQASLDSSAPESAADGPAVQSREPASVVGEPSDDELLELSQFHCISYTLSNGSVVSPFVEGTDIRSEVLSFARAAISRYGHQPAPPVEGGVGEAALVRRMCEIILGNTFGNEELDSLALLVWHHPDVLNASPVPTEEVRELVAWLQCVAEEVRTEDYATIHSPDLPARAADLLSQRHPTRVLVSERLPGPEDCDAEGRCWLFSKVEKEWRLIDAGNPGIPHLKYCFSHWLPATALPLPQGEPQP